MDRLSCPTELRQINFSPLWTLPRWPLGVAAVSLYVEHADPNANPTQSDSMETDTTGEMRYGKCLCGTVCWQWSFL